MASKSAIIAGRGAVTLSIKDELQKGLDSAKARLQSFAGAVASVGATIGGIGAAITVPFLGALSSFTDMGRAVFTASRITGMGLEQVQQTAAGLGTDMEGVTHASEHLGHFLQQVANGSQTAADELTQLGLSFADLNALTPEGRLQAVAGALGSVTDASTRLALTRSVFGRSGAELNVSGGAAGVQTRQARAQQLGGIVSADDVNLAKSTGKAFAEMGTVLSAVWREVGAAAAPVMREVAQLVTNVLIGVRQWVADNRPLLTQIFEWGRLLVGVGAGLGFLAAVIYGAGTALGFLSAAVAWVNSLGILQAGVWLVNQAVMAGVWLVVTGLSVVYTVFGALLWAAGTAWTVLTAIATFSTGQHLAYWTVIGLLIVAQTALTAWEWLRAAATGAVSAATGAYTAVTSLATVGTWLWSAATTVLTGGLNLLGAALAAVVLGGLAVSALTWAVGAAFGALGALGASALAGVMGAWESLTGSFTDGAGSIWDAFQPLIGLFQRMGDTFATSFSTVKSLLLSGDLEGAARVGWIGLQLVWQQGLNFLRPFWEDFRDWLGGDWDRIWTNLQMRLNDFLVWITNSIQHTLVALLSDMGPVLQALVGPQAADMVAAANRTLAQVEQDARRRRRSLRDEMSAQDQTAIEQAWLQMGVLAESGDEARAALRQAEREAGQVAGQQEESRLQGQLDQEAYWAEVNDMLRQIDQQAAAAGGAGGGIVGRMADHTSGTFSGAALAGFSGGSTSAAERTADAVAEGNGFLGRILQAIEAQEGAEFS